MEDMDQHDTVVRKGGDTSLVTPCVSRTFDHKSGEVNLIWPADLPLSDTNTNK